VRRDPALARLSRDHHQTLVIAQRLRRATGATAAEARAAFLDHWESHARHHFRLEEEVLLPAYAAFGDAHHHLVARALCDHVAIRQRADALAREPTSTVEPLHELGVLLADHVRLEERELFVLIERTMPATQLATLAAALDEADRGHAGG
jgi:hypothetical protein